MKNKLLKSWLSGVLPGEGSYLPKIENKTVICEKCGIAFKTSADLFNSFVKCPKGHETFVGVKPFKDKQE